MGMEVVEKWWRNVPILLLVGTSDGASDVITDGYTDGVSDDVTTASPTVTTHPSPQKGVEIPFAASALSALFQSPNIKRGFSNSMRGVGDGPR
jgi:hypothetical protein